jgi:hypothetical protein
MAVSQALRRLLRVLELEEEQKRIALKSAQSDLARLERAMEASEERKRSGRELVAASAYTGELTERLAGIEEVRAGERSAKLLQPRVADQQTLVTAQEEAYLDKRVERRQAEALISKRRRKRQLRQPGVASSSWTTGI